jgi:hypothetical protein
MKTAILLLTATLALLVRPALAQDKSNALAIIVNKASAMDDVSLTDLAKIFKAQKATGPDGVAFVLGVRDAGPDHVCAIKKIYGMDTDAQYDKYFLQAAFAGTVQGPPAVLSSSAAVLQFVSASPGGISFLCAGDVDGSVKVLKVDGKAPGDAGYELTIK